MINKKKEIYILVSEFIFSSFKNINNIITHSKFQNNNNEKFMYQKKWDTQKL